MAYIGMAVAISQSLDIPIIICSLAFELSRRREHMFQLDANFLAFLNAATQQEDEGPWPLRISMNGGQH